MAKVHINVVVIDISVNTPPSPFNIVYMMDIQLQRHHFKACSGIDRVRRLRFH
jgi:hypothetical protein